MKKRVTARFLAPALVLLGGFRPVLAGIESRIDVGVFIREVAARRHLGVTELSRLFGQVEMQQKILDAIDHPAESKPWWEYRKNFLTEAHIQGGADFWKRNRAALEEASSRYGVDAEMIVAIIGVETRYGQSPGTYRVIDALSTLTFDYPRRADFFRKELEEFLLLCREEGIDPLLPRGSYAGAMGMPQFMPSSYRRYATDLDGDHHRNIWTNPADAIASVANYFAHAGWRNGESVAAPAKVSAVEVQRLLDNGLTPEHSIAQWRALGVESRTPLPDLARARLIVLATEAGPEYWLGMHNFIVITHYNRSPLYAMAVYQLGKAIRARQGM